MNTIGIGNTIVIEFVQFKLRDGFDSPAFIATSQAVTQFAKRQPGFRSRTLSRSETGMYYDHIEWASMAEAKAALQASMEDPSLADFMQSIDPDSVVMTHNMVIQKA